MKNILNKFGEFLQTDRGNIVILGVISLAAFGIFIPFVGFYWDDWIWKFFSHAYSSEYLLWQPVDRPLAGTLHIFLDSLFGDNPVYWQLGNLLFRWASAAAFYWMLRKAFPGQKKGSAVISIFFLIYPGFSEQWISIAFIHHLVPMTLMWVSFALMFDAIETGKKPQRLLKYSGSFILALVVMLTTEYFYGIEIFRGILLFYYLWRKDPGKKAPAYLLKILKKWGLFAGMTIAMVLWRGAVGVREGATYSVNVEGLFSEGIFSGLGRLGLQIINGVYSATVEVLLKMFTYPGLEEFGRVKTLIYGAMLIGGFILSWLYFRLNKESEINFSRRFGIDLGVLGLLGLLLGGLPVWAAGLQYAPNFPADRLGLTMMMGVGLLFTGLVVSLIKNSSLRAGIIAVLFAFGLGANFISGSAYVQSWKDQETFWRQFTTRVPALEPGTVVVVPEVPVAYMSDLSFMMTLNWLYDQSPREDGLKYGLFYSETRSIFREISEGMAVNYDRRLVKFESDLDNVLLLSYSPNNCLYVFDPLDGPYNPNSRNIDGRLLPYSNPGQIDTSIESFDQWPEFFEPIREDNWCYYFQRISLELQRKDYPEAARLGDLALSKGLIPNRSWERAPLIEAYGMIQRWDDALVLTQEAMSYKASGEKLLCNVWSRIEAQTTNTAEKEAVFEQVAALLTCANE